MERGAAFRIGSKGDLSPWKSTGKPGPGGKRFRSGMKPGGKDGKTWYLVEADGLEGYIRSDMLTKQAD